MLSKVGLDGPSADRLVLLGTYPAHLEKEREVGHFMITSQSPEMEFGIQLKSNPRPINHMNIQAEGEQCLPKR
ncbi:hypothetical protein Y1Q_0002537 [Alligator mississippiensis]|uniref:Uncharacterized protein n=1 Tax=Alligator mississippiensis TaxID=8496 RepID=A0A151NBD6_ALLMI|nr:hypothetical protein Y1Q_0002537 [Alligator mississippiensis]